mgnify:CR=1 FL=1
MQTFSLKQSDIKKKWFLIDANGLVLGRLAVKIASILRGKHKSTFTPHLDCGDNVIVINAKKVMMTGNKIKQKKYYKHTGYPGGLRTTSFERMMQDHPDRVLKKAVWGMLPNNRLGRQLLKKLRVYAGPEHRHEAQQPTALEL